jgi:hypothetical protein
MVKRRLTTGLIVLGASLIPAGAVEAAIELPISYAQQQSARLAAKLCNSEQDCDLAEVTQCARVARSRVDCKVAWSDSSNNARCSYTVINTLRATKFRERTTRVGCTSDSAVAVFRAQRQIGVVPGSTSIGAVAMARRHRG